MGEPGPARGSCRPLRRRRLSRPAGSARRRPGPSRSPDRGPCSLAARPGTDSRSRSSCKERRPHAQFSNFDQWGKAVDKNAEGEFRDEGLIYCIRNRWHLSKTSTSSVFHIQEMLRTIQWSQQLKRTSVLNRSTLFSCQQVGLSRVQALRKSISYEYFSPLSLHSNPPHPLSDPRLIKASPLGEHARITKREGVLLY